MRTIKFKGKSTNNGEWVYGFYAFIQGTHLIITENNERVEVIEESVAQFTGEYDKKRTEVYENDLLYYKDSKGENYYIVKFNRGVFERVYLFNVRGYDEENSFPLQSKYYLVAGTVLENNDLLQANYKYKVN